jgi:hypothetical protein
MIPESETFRTLSYMARTASRPFDAVVRDHPDRVIGQRSHRRFEITDEFTGDVSCKHVSGNSRHDSQQDATRVTTIEPETLPPSKTRSADCPVWSGSCSPAGRT